MMWPCEQMFSVQTSGTKNNGAIVRAYVPRSKKISYVGTTDVNGKRDEEELGEMGATTMWGRPWRERKCQQSTRRAHGATKKTLNEIKEKKRNQEKKMKTIRYI